jgi:hypothetical protein
MTERWQQNLGALIKEYRGSMSQSTLAELLSDKTGRSIRQGTVSDHENGRRWEGNFELIKSYREVLNIPVEKIHEVLDLPVVDHGPAPKTFPEIVAQDATLSKAAKEHLLNQYELLQMATMHQRSGRPVLHQDQEDEQRPRRKHGSA